MISDLIMFLLILMIMFSYFLIHPIYMSISMSMIFLLYLLNESMITDSLWVIMIFLMLFVGGILVMFMMVASLHPNEKYLPVKLLLSMLLLVLTMFMSSTKTDYFEDSSMKLFFEYFFMLSFFSSMFFIYFFMIMNTVGSVKLMLRSFSTICWKILNL